MIIPNRASSAHPVYIDPRDPTVYRVYMLLPDDVGATQDDLTKYVRWYLGSAEDALDHALVGLSRLDTMNAAWRTEYASTLGVLRHKLAQLQESIDQSHA